jgi:hypothetical protein
LQILKSFPYDVSMADNGIPARLAALDNGWLWVSDAPARVDALTSTFSDLIARLETIGDEDVNNKALAFVEATEKSLPDLTDKLTGAQNELEEHSAKFDEAASNLSERVDRIAKQIG